MTKQTHYIIEERINDGCGGCYWIGARTPTNIAPDEQTALAYRDAYLAHRADWKDNRPPLYREDVRLRPISEPSTVEKQEAVRRKTMLTHKRDLFRTFHKRFAAESHELRCQIEDGLDKRPITEAHADAYDELVAWLAHQLQQIHWKIPTD